MTGRVLSWILAAVLAAPLLAFGQAGGERIQVEGAWARRAALMTGAESKAGSGNSAVYGMLVNAGKAPDALVAVTSDAAATVEIHESYRESGMMMMRPVKKIDVPAGKKVEMKPGGYHIMLLDLKRNLKPGKTVRVTLHFDKAGKIPITATVK
jgi:periplasmic copper chaperone A